MQAALETAACFALRERQYMSLIGLMITVLVLLICEVFGLLASGATAPRIVEVIRAGRFPRWDLKRDLTFKNAPLSGCLFSIHLVLMLFAAVGCIVLPVWFVYRSM